MKIKIATTALAAALKKAAAVVPTSSPKPIVQRALLDVAPEMVGMFATNLETELMTACPYVSIDEPGKVLLPVRELLAILAVEQSEDVVLGSTKKGILLKTDKGRFSLGTESPDEFPVAPTVNGSNCAKVASDALLLAIQRTAFAADVTVSRYALGGVQFSLAGRVLRLAATDGRMLAEQTLKSDGDAKASGLLPVSALAIISRALPTGQAVTLTITDNRFAISTAGCVISGALLEGRFPSITKIFADNAAKERATATAPAKYLAAAIAQVSAVLSSESAQFHLNQGRLSVSDWHAADPSLIEVVTEQCSQEACVNLQPRLLAAALRAIGDLPSIDFAITNDDHFFFETDDGFRFIAMACAAEQKVKK